MSLPDGSTTEEPETSSGRDEQDYLQATTTERKEHNEIDLVTNTTAPEEESVGHIKRVTFCYTVDVYYPRPDHYPPPGNQISFLYTNLFI